MGLGEESATKGMFLEDSRRRLLIKAECVPCVPPFPVPCVITLSFSVLIKCLKQQGCPHLTTVGHHSPQTSSPSGSSRGMQSSHVQWRALHGSVPVEPGSARSRSKQTVTSVAVSNGLYQDCPQSCDGSSSASSTRHSPYLMIETSVLCHQGCPHDLIHYLWEDLIFK